ncbi:multidrug transporter [Clostridium gelidum]|uniref:Multidrug transporter n=1 Tax=Clostridium gelidum TaxID=704125 RepID=A0ABN6IZM2_9CLOT|nr:TolC family protein [Clostridium gelidum]BCZ47554.1 multidrug transporter [Clostridium gelidum]
MRKDIKKVLTIGILLSIMNSSIVPVFAVENNEKMNVSKSTLSDEKAGSISTQFQNVQTIKVKKILTLDKAIEGAINNSDKLKLKSKEIKMYEDKMDLQEKTNDYYKVIGQKVYDFPYDKFELQEKQTKQSKDFMEDQIASDITNKYNDMILKEIEINKSKRNLEFKKKDLEFMKGKLTLGMATPNQLNDAQIEIKSLQDDITSKDNSLNNNKDYFKVITDLDLKNTYTLDYNVNYTKFKIAGSADEYIDDKIDKYVKYDTEMLKLTKDYMKDLKDDGIKDIMDKEVEKIPDKSSSVAVNADGTNTFDSGSYALKLIAYQQNLQEYYTKINAYGEYLDGKYSVSTAQVKLDDTKKNLKNALKESYSTLLDLENKIDTLKEQVNSTNTKVRFAKAQVDMGLMLQNDYDKQILENEDLDTSLRKLIYTHNNLRDSIQKPWILSN